MEQITMFEGHPEQQHAKQYSTVARFIGSHNLSAQDRQEHDYYATEPVAAEWLLKLERIGPSVWEPACGEGHLSKVMEAHGLKVRSTDLIDRGYGIGGVDFLQQQEKWPGDIVTNPPYKYALDFIQHALEITEDGALICMFLKVQFLEGKQRKTFFENTPPRTVWVSSSRIQCAQNGNFERCSSMLAQAWYVWEKGYKGSTTVRWFN